MKYPQRNQHNSSILSVNDPFIILHDWIKFIPNIKCWFYAIRSYFFFTTFGGGIDNQTIEKDANILGISIAVVCSPMQRTSSPRESFNVIYICVHDDERITDHASNLRWKDWNDRQITTCYRYYDALYDNGERTLLLTTSALQHLIETPSHLTLPTSATISETWEK